MKHPISSRVSMKHPSGHNKEFMMPALLLNQHSHWPNKLLMLCDAVDFVEREYQKEKKVVGKRKREHDNKKPRPNPSPAWVVQKFRDMGATGEHLNTMCKALTKSDIDKSQNRLLLSTSDVERSNLLERVAHLDDNFMSDAGVEVEVLDGQMRRYLMVFKYLGSNLGYRIIRPDWHVFVAKNGLNCTGDRVHLCMFYVPVVVGGDEQKLRLGIVREPS